MAGLFDYDVTAWPVGDPYQDIGEVINSILADIKSKQTESFTDGRGKPGAVIHIPAGDYRLKTQVVIDISFLRIEGVGHGFISSSIRYNSPEHRDGSWHDIWPGGSRIMADYEVPLGATQAEGAAFLVKRDGEPRISSVEFSGFCIDGLHFEDRNTDTGDPENTYLNGKTGIYVDCRQDSFRFNGMGLIYLEHAITVCQGDAISIHDNFIAECGNCIELIGPGQAGKITDNLIGAGYRQPDRRRIPRAFHLRREYGRNTGDRKQRLSQGQKQPAFLRCRTIQRVGKPVPFILSGNADPGSRIFREPRFCESPVEGCRTMAPNETI